MNQLLPSSETELEILMVSGVLSSNITHPEIPYGSVVFANP